MKDQYIIIDFRNMEYMKDSNGEINYYNSELEAREVCGMYELENAWVCKLMFNHIENDII